MPNGSHAPLSTPRPRNGEPQPAPPPAASEPATTKRDLASWWKQFSKRGNVKKEEDKGTCLVPFVCLAPQYRAPEVPGATAETAALVPQSVENRFG